MSRSLRDRWTTSILHLSAFIAVKKNGLLTVHGVQSLTSVLIIILAEALLLIISLPSYLAAQPVGSGIKTKEYRLRRALTLGFIGTICIIWILKLTLILTITRFADTNQLASSTTRTEAYTQSGATETLADDILIAKESAELAAPTVTKIQNIRGKIAFWGTAPAKSIVIFTLTEASKGIVGKRAAPKIYTTQSNANGDFELWEDASVFNLPAGDYTGSVSTYDPVREIKSAESHSFSFTATESFLNSLLYSADAILNIIALVVIIIGLLMTVLVT